MRIIVSLFFLLIFPLISLANPQDSIFREMKDTTAFKKKLAEASKKMLSIECHFTQTKNSDMLNKPVISEGYFCYKNKTQVRWEYLQPFSYIIVINNGKLVVKDETRTSNYDMTANKSFLEINTKLTAIMDGSILENHAGFAVKYSGNDKSYRIELTPVSNDMADFFSSIAVSFDNTDLSVVALKMFEKTGDYTEIEFHDKKINQPVSDEKFVIR
jgi:outer membrane lipoprotein-sorting protein